VERELRARAEQKEGEEREERVAANAQLLALQQAHAAEVEGMRVRGNGAHSVVHACLYMRCGQFPDVRTTTHLVPSPPLWA